MRYANWILAISFAGTMLMGLFLSISVPASGNPAPPVEPREYLLTEGKNTISFDSVFFARDLVRANPSIETISYFDERQNTTVGYVNVFGGIGKNFLIVPNTMYEIVVAHNVTIYA